MILDITWQMRPALLSVLQILVTDVSEQESVGSASSEGGHITGPICHSATVTENGSLHNMDDASVPVVQQSATPILANMPSHLTTSSQELVTKGEESQQELSVDLQSEKQSNGELPFKCIFLEAKILYGVVSTSLMNTRD